MTRLVCVAVAVVLTAGVALRAGTVTVLGPAVVAPGETFEIQLDLQSPENLMLGWFIDGIMATNGAVPGPVTGSTAAEQAAYHYDNTCGWDTSSANVLLGWVSQTAFPVGPMDGVPAADGGTNGVAFRMSVVAPDTPDSFFEVTVTGGLLGDEPYFEPPEFIVLPLSVYVTPEPTGVLLLLAGALMLRRRR
ncbi:MAG: PEP-CTERM sorting domain-containing protein [Phycisphaerae bacterium]|nr:PEP-CTERM sorting domain-containing protein [Phycisphaerae bacterium]